MVERTIADIEAEVEPIEQEILKLSDVQTEAKSQKLALRKQADVLWKERTAYQIAHPSSTEGQSIG